jgi:molybdate transport system substrate-binding protein
MKMFGSSAAHALRRFALVAACAALCTLLPVAQAQTPVPALRIAAAADLEPVLPAVLAAFEKQTGIPATATYQSSATLAQQITNGAPFDLFLSADTGFPQKVIDAGMATETKPVVYARGTLVLWARKDSAALHGKAVSMSILSDPGLQSVAIANPEHAPYGRAAQAAIAKLGLTDELAPKLRVAANIAQAAQYADSGNAQVGFISLTSASTPRLMSDGTYVPIPAADYPAILQGAVVVLHAQNAGNGQIFLRFLLGPATASLLKQKGLMPPQ